MENEESSHGDETEADQVVPFHGLAEVENRKHGKDGQRDDFLNGFQLRGVEFVRAEAAGWNLEAIFKESDAPTGNHDLPECNVAVFQVPVPGEGHEDVGNGKQQN